MEFHSLSPHRFLICNPPTFPHRVADHHPALSGVMDQGVIAPVLVAAWLQRIYSILFLCFQSQKGICPILDLNTECLQVQNSQAHRPLVYLSTAAPFWKTDSLFGIWVEPKRAHWLLVPPSLSGIIQAFGFNTLLDMWMHLGLFRFKLLFTRFARLPPGSLFTRSPSSTRSVVFFQGLIAFVCCVDYPSVLAFWTP